MFNLSYDLSILKKEISAISELLEAVIEKVEKMDERNISNSSLKIILDYNSGH